MLIPLKLSNRSEAPVKIQILRVGSFKSATHGNFDIKKETLEKFKQNFDDNVKGYDDGKLPIDYFHESEKIAAGWINRLILENDSTELWAEVTWTPSGRQRICDKELRYISADFFFDYKDNETEISHGPTLNGAALTNIPFVKKMSPVVQLNRKNNLTVDTNDTNNKTLGGQMTIEDAMKKIADLEEQIKTLKGKKMEDDDAEKKDLKKKNEDMQAKYAELEAKFAEHEKSLKLSAKKATFDKMMAEGKAVEAQREAFMADDLMKFAEGAVAVNLSGKGEGTKPEEKAKSAQEEVLKLANELVKTKKLSLARAISDVLFENKELNARYKEETKI